MINTTKQILMQMDVKEEARMEIKKPAIAGTLESSDCQVTVEAGEGKVDFSLESAVINQYGNQIKKVAYETLENLGIDNVKLTIVDKGALDCTIKARIEAAVTSTVTTSFFFIFILIFLSELLLDTGLS